MNRFLEHHSSSLRFVYSCFDRILFNAIIQPLQSAAILVGFLSKCCGVTAITRAYLRQVSQQYHGWVEQYAHKRRIPIVEPPKDVRREEWVEPFFRRRNTQDSSQIAVILKSRENARIAVSYPTASGGNHIELYQRFVWQYYYYIQDRDFGRMFIRMCPYLPFNARICINGHNWLACRLREEGIRFRQTGNCFLSCADPTRLQQLADQFSSQHVVAMAHRWLAQLTPFFTDRDRRANGCGYRLFASQVEYCTNLIFHRRAALDQLQERLLDLNRTIGRPDKLSTIFGRRITVRTPGGFKTQIADHHLGSPVIRSDYKQASVKAYVRDHLNFRVEATTYNTKELGIGKSVENLDALRTKMKAINHRYLEVQQDVLETFLDRGQLAHLRAPTITATGRRIPGLKPDDPRLLAVMQALTRFAHVARGDLFRTRDLHPWVAESLKSTHANYSLGQLRYDLSKLKAKGLIARIPRTHTYRLTPEGYRISVLFLKLYHRLYAPLTAGILTPVPEDDKLAPEQQAVLDRLYTAVDQALSQLLDHLGLKAA